MNEIELKPCPFCGSTKLKVVEKRRTIGFTWNDIHVWIITASMRCNVCKARGAPISRRYYEFANDSKDIHKELIEGATENWNTRK